VVLKGRIRGRPQYWGQITGKACNYAENKRVHLWVHFVFSMPVFVPRFIVFVAIYSFLVSPFMGLLVQGRNIIEKL